MTKQEIINTYTELAGFYNIPLVEIESLFTEFEQAVREECIKIISTHPENEGSYCDTGEDMEWACRSKCVDLAIKRLTK